MSNKEVQFFLIRKQSVFFIEHNIISNVVETYLINTNTLSLYTIYTELKFDFSIVTYYTFLGFSF